MVKANDMMVNKEKTNEAIRATNIEVGFGKATGLWWAMHLYFVPVQLEKYAT